jgi:hypothetical protein
MREKAFIDRVRKERNLHLRDSKLKMSSVEH